MFQYYIINLQSLTPQKTDSMMVMIYENFVQCSIAMPRNTYSMHYIALKSDKALLINRGPMEVNEDFRQLKILLSSEKGKGITYSSLAYRNKNCDGYIYERNFRTPLLSDSHAVYYTRSKCNLFNFHAYSKCKGAKFLSCREVSESDLSIYTFQTCADSTISTKENLYYMFKWMIIDHYLPVLVQNNSYNRYHCHEQISLYIITEDAVIMIPKVTHSIQIWPRKFMLRQKQLITALVHVTAKTMHVNSEKSVCSITLKLEQQLMLHKHTIPSSVPREQKVTDTLSALGVQSKIFHRGKTHYIVKPPTKTMMRFNVSQFCHTQLKAQIFTYFLKKELLEILRYVEKCPAIIFNAFQKDMQV